MIRKLSKLLVDAFSRESPELEADIARLGRSSQLAEEAPHVVVIANRRGLIEYANPKFTEMTGYSREDAPGLSLRILGWGLEPVTGYLPVWKAIETGCEWQGEFLSKTRDEIFCRESATVSPLEFPIGKVTHFLVLKGRFGADNFGTATEEAQ